MKILFISYWYNPEPVFKPHDLAKGLVSKGHKVTVITGFPNYPKGVIYREYRNKVFMFENIDGVNIIRIPYIIDRSQSSARRVFSYMTFSLAAIFAGFLIKERFELIWTYQIGLPGVLLSILKKVCLIHEVQDLWPDWAMGIGKKPLKCLYRILGAQELFIYKRAAKVITISNSFAKILCARCLAAHKIVVIPNWADELCFYPAEKDESIRLREGFEDKFRIMYIGNLGTAQQLENVIRAAELLKDQENIEIIFIGDGVEKRRLENIAKGKNLFNVRFLGFRPHSEISKYIAWSDILLIHLGNNPIYEITIPSKTIGYLAAGKPILAVCKGETADLIKESGAGLICDPGDPLSLAEKIIQFSSLSKETLAAMGRNGRFVFLDKFTKARLLGLYEITFSGLLKYDS